MLEKLISDIGQGKTMSAAETAVLKANCGWSRLTELSKDSSADAHCQLQLIKLNDYKLALNIARLDSIKPEVLEAIVDNWMFHNNHDIIKAIVLNDNTTVELTQKLIVNTSSGNWNYQGLIVSLTRYGKILEHYSRSDDRQIKIKCAANKHCPIEVLELLSNDCDDHVGRWVNLVMDCYNE